LGKLILQAAYFIESGQFKPPRTISPRGHFSCEAATSAPPYYKKIHPTGWLLLSVMIEGRVGLKSVSGYGGVTFGNVLMDKELRILAVPK
jgi:hypothetical protein